jgi:hypothetical protein
VYTEKLSTLLMTGCRGGVDVTASSES